MAYGSLAGVAALVPRHTDGGVFTENTRPTAAQVTNWLDQLSAFVDTALAAQGFTTPVTATQVLPALAFFVNEEAASMSEAANGHGRFGPSAKKPGKGRFTAIFDDIADFVENNAAGFENMGAARPNNVVGAIGYRSTDEVGNDTYPMFQREDFGQSFDNID